MFLCHLQCPCLCPVHQCRSYHCPGHLLIGLHIHFPVSQHSRRTLSTSSSIRSALCGWRPHPVLHLSTKVVNVFNFFKSLPVNGSLRLGARCTQVFSIISTDLQSSLFHCSSQLIKHSFYMLSNRLSSTIISSTNSIHQWSCYLM